MISPEQLAAIAGKAATLTLGEEMLPAMREVFPGIHFSYCMDDDVEYEKAAFLGDAFNIYLVDGHGHCLKFTTDADAATGVVIAEIIPEDD